MELTYRLENLDFDGPLGLLLTLIEKNKVDIYDIPIAEITSQYIECISAMEVKDADTMSEFLLMASTLICIKSRMLLPGENEEAKENKDPRDELVARLLEYKKFRCISEQLSDMEDYAEKYLYNYEENIPDEVKTYIPPVDLDSLFSGVDMIKLKQVFQEVLKRRENLTDKVHGDFSVIRRERVSVGKCIGKLVDYARTKDRFSFREMLEDCTDKTEIIGSFLAMLELMKAGMIVAVQDSFYDDITLMATDNIDSGELNISTEYDEPSV